MEELSVKSELKKLDKLKIPDKAKEKIRQRLNYQLKNNLCPNQKNSLIEKVKKLLGR